jgi:hypothetical protein
VFTVRRPSALPPREEAEGDRRPPHSVRRRYPSEALVFDTETLPGPAQNLRLLVWRFYRDPPGRAPGTTCIEEGIAYPDELEPHELDILRECVATHEAVTSPGYPTRLCLESLSWWIEERFHGYGYGHRDRCAVVGFNLLFDLGRLARYWAPGRDGNRGGFSIGLVGEFNTEGKWKDRRYYARLLMRSIDPRRTLISWSPREKRDPDPDRGRGRFVDLRTLAYALTDQPHTLETACAAFGDPYTKAEVDYATLTPELVRYALEDARHSGLLYRNCLAELARHTGVELEPHLLYSPATVGVRYLEAMGVLRPLVKFTDLTGEELGWDEPGTKRPTIPPDARRGDLDPRLLGWSMSAFYGGRAEARIVRTPVPICLVDFTSMYPAVNALLNTWPLLRADRLETIDATVQARELLSAPDLLERCLAREAWAQIGVTLVQVEPDGDVLPARAGYDAASDDFGIGVNPFSYEGALWYTLPDLVAAALLNSITEGANTPAPRVVRAVRLVTAGDQPDLEPVRLRGGASIDPYTEDPFVRMIEERHRVLRDPTLAPEERERLERFLKITANATAYGVLARFDRQERGPDVGLNVFGPDEQPTIGSSQTPEYPGPFCFPPIAAAITAGARLMLALLERLVTDAAGHYAFCDTDSMAIVTTSRGTTLTYPTAGGNAIKALPWHDVREILARFDQLNPFDPALVPSPWKVEVESLTRPLHCYAISAKRYCLYQTGDDGTSAIVGASDHSDSSDDERGIVGEDLLEDWSEHGLGLYLDPTSPDTGRPRRDKQGRRLWVAEAWQWILDDAYARNPPLPHWATTYALTRFTVSSPSIENWFEGYNTNQPPENKIRPGSFGLIAHPLSLGQDSKPLPFSPYESAPNRWPGLEWFDRRNGQPVRVIDDHSNGPDRRAHALARGDVPITLLADILARYQRRAEHKSLAPNGYRASGETQGLLLRRPVISSPLETELIGKEANKIEERQTGEVTDPADYRNTYGRRGSAWPMVIAILQEIGAPETTRQTGLSRSSVYGVLHHQARPLTAHAHEYETLALRFASERLQGWGLEPPSEPVALLNRYVSERAARGEHVKRCEWDGNPIPAGRRSDARFCSDRCRRAAARSRT